MSIELKSYAANSRVSYEGGSGTNAGLLRIVLTHSIVQ